MDSGTIKVPTWALPLIVSLFIGAISYGAAQANAESTAEEVERIERIVAETATRSQHNGTGVQLNTQAIRQITESLSKQEDTARASDEKLAQLIPIMLTQKNDK